MIPTLKGKVRSAKWIICKKITELLCLHDYKTTLIFGPASSPLNDIKSCTKCTKSETLFSGTSAEWRKHHNLSI